MRGRARAGERDALGGRHCTNSEMPLEAIIGHVGNALGGDGHVDLEAVIKYVWRWTWRPRSSNSEMPMEAIIRQGWKCSWR